MLIALVLAGWHVAKGMGKVVMIQQAIETGTKNARLTTAEAEQFIFGQPCRALHHFQSSEKSQDPKKDSVFAVRWQGEFDMTECPTPKGFAPLVLHLGGGSVTGRYTSTGRNQVTAAGASVTIQPEGEGIMWRSEGVVDFLHFYLPIGTLHQQAQSQFGSASALERFSIAASIDAPLRHCYQSFYKAVRAGPMSEMEVQGWTQMLIGQVFRVFAGSAPPKQDARALEPRLVGLVRDLIEDRLEEKIALEDMAALTGWDVYRFSRAFRNAVGQTPHQYVLSRRIEHAKNDLRQSDMPLAEVAFAAGFSSQQHMTNLFSKHLGQTPAKYRNEVSK